MWTVAAVPMTSGLFFAIFRRLFPARPPDPSEPPLTDEERRVFRRWELASLIPFFLSMPLLVFGWYLALRWADGLFYLHEVPGTLFLIRPIPIYWSLPALFLGLVSSALPVDLFCRVLLRERYRRYERHNDERNGFDSNRALALLAALVGGGAVVAFVAGVTTFARFTETGIEIGRPFRLRSVYYPYAKVRTIEHRITLQAPNGDIVDRPRHVLFFDDGSYWSTRGGLRDPVPALDEQIIQLVSRRSGRAIVKRP